MAGPGQDAKHPWMPITSGLRDWQSQMSPEAVERFEAVKMRLCSASVRRRLGELIGGDRGQAEVARADHWMTDQKIQNPACMASMILARLNGR